MSETQHFIVGEKNHFIHVMSKSEMYQILYSHELHVLTDISLMLLEEACS